MTYDKYMKYKIKYYKLKELEKKLIQEGKLKYDDIKPTIQSGGTIPKKDSRFSIREGTIPKKDSRFSIREGTIPKKDSRFSIREGTIPKEDSIINTNNNLKCHKCNNIIQIAGSHKLCTNCNTNILNINKLTDTPNYNNHPSQNINKLAEQHLQKANELYNQLAKYTLSDSAHSDISDIDQHDILKYNNNDDKPIDNNNINTETESVVLSILNSSEN
jgi:hypothetical protein